MATPTLARVILTGATAEPPSTHPHLVALLQQQGERDRLGVQQSRWLAASVNRQSASFAVA